MFRPISKLPIFSPTVGPRQVAAIFECAWFATSRHAKLEGGEIAKGVGESGKLNRMKSSISGRLKKPMTDMGGATKRNEPEPEPEPTEQGGDKAKKGREAMTKTWSNVVKGLKKEDELESQFG